MKQIFLLLFLFTGFISGCDPYPKEFPLSRSATHAPTILTGASVVYPPYHFLAGEPIQPGSDAYGYDYAKHSFRGPFENRERGSTGLPPVPIDAVELKLLWNESWLSGTDRDGDGFLDRHPDCRNYRGSGAWISIHMKGENVGKAWEYAMKAVAVPVDARLRDGVWEEDGTEIGPAIWGCFAMIFEFSTSPEGLTYADKFKHRFPCLGLD